MVEKAVRSFAVFSIDTVLSLRDRRTGGIGYRNHGGYRALLLETLTTEDGTPLRRLEGHGRLYATLAALRTCLSPSVRRRTSSPRRPLRLTRLAALGIVLELFVEEK